MKSEDYLRLRFREQHTHTHTHTHQRIIYIYFCSSLISMVNHNGFLRCAFWIIYLANTSNTIVFTEHYFWLFLSSCCMWFKQRRHWCFILSLLENIDTTLDHKNGRRRGYKTRRCWNIPSLELIYFFLKLHTFILSTKSYTAVYLIRFNFII